MLELETTVFKTDLEEPNYHKLNTFEDLTLEVKKYLVKTNFKTTDSPRYSQFWLLADLKTASNEGKLHILAYLSLK